MMKIEAIYKQLPKVFVPKSVIITFESQNDIDKFGALCNHAGITDILNLSGDGKLATHEIMQSLGSDVNKYWDENILNMFKKMDSECV